MRVDPQLTTSGPDDCIGARGPGLQPFSGSGEDPSIGGLFGPCGDRRGGGVAPGRRDVESELLGRFPGEPMFRTAFIIRSRDCSNSSSLISPRSRISRRSSRVKPTVDSEPAKMLLRTSIASPPPARIRMTNRPTHGSTSANRVLPEAGNRTSRRPITRLQRPFSYGPRLVLRPGHSSRRPAFP